MLETMTAPRYEPYADLPPASPGLLPKTTLWRRLLDWMQSLCRRLTHNKSAGVRVTPTRPRKLQKRPPPSLRRSVTTQEQLVLGEVSQGSIPQAPQVLEPAAGLSPSRRTSKHSSVFGLRSLLDDFACDVERTFLTPVEKTVLGHMQHVTGQGKRIRPLMPTDAEILLMPDRDSASAVVAVGTLTKYLPEAEKDMMCHDLDGLLTKEQRAVLRRVLHDTNFEVRCVEVESRCHTPEMPARNIAFGQSPRAVSRGCMVEHLDSTDGPPITVRRDGKVRRGSCLRGGGGDAGGAQDQDPRLWDLMRRPRRLEDHERPPVALWRLAGGRIRRDMAPTMGVPTGVCLRERRQVEVMNRDLVGFWKTVAGVRAAKTTRSQLADVCQKLQNAAGEEQKASAEATETGGEGKVEEAVASEDAKGEEESKEATTE